MIKADCVIIGGGVAGLCAAIRLTELGIYPLLIEAGSYPSHKVCGEFLSPECIPILEAWNIHPIAIHEMSLCSEKSSTSFLFPKKAGSLSHVTLDPALACHAKSKDVEILTNTSVLNLIPKRNHTDKHTIELSNGATIHCHHLIIATGRIPTFSAATPTFKYIGFKAHFKDFNFQNTLELFSLPGVYLGIAPIEENKFNVAGLANINFLKKFSNADAFIQHLISKTFLNEYFSDAKSLFPQWMTTLVPDFGIKNTPSWMDTYFIGDAASTIPPATGNGLSLAILGGRLVAEYVKKNQPNQFKSAWKKITFSPIFWGRCLHHCFLFPHYFSPLFKLANWIPSFKTRIYKMIRQ